MTPLEHSESPNVILIVMDCARADHMSCYGYRRLAHRPTTPNIDRIACQGVLYETAISPAIWTLPSIASLFTGLYPSQHGTTRSHQWLEDRFATLAELLAGQGYYTAGFSANPWVSGNTNLARGFHCFQPMWGVVDSQAGGLARLTNRAYQIMRKRYYHTLKRLNPLRKLYHLTLQRRKDKGGTSMNRAVQRWLSGFNQSQPFFLFLHYMDAHEPFFSPEPYGSLFLDGFSPAEVRAVNQDSTRYLARQVEMTGRDFDILKALYDGQLAYQDAKVGEMWDFFQREGILGNTIVVITSDHGQVLGEDQGIMGHSYSMHDSLIRVPLIINHPTLWHGGRREHRLVQTVDLFPTLARLVGAPASQAALACDLVDGDRRAYAVSEFLAPDIERFQIRFPDFDPSPYDRRLRAVRTLSRKYVWASDGSERLFDLEQDPHESRDLAGTRQQEVRLLRDYLHEWLGRVEEPELGDHEPQMDPETLERLKGLGYLA